MNRDELIQKMRDAWSETVVKNPQPTREHCRKERMAAALDVVLDEVLGDSTIQEWNPIPGNATRLRLLDSFLEILRAHYQKVNTAEERVTVEPERDSHYWRVYLDGEDQNLCFSLKPKAEIYRLGLIAQLKEGK